MRRPILRLNAYALAKLDFYIHNYDHEVGGFLVAEIEDQPLVATDFVLVKQEATKFSFEFDKESGMYDYAREMSRVRKLEQYQCIRLWTHTHPNMSATPSPTDERCFSSQFCDLAKPGHWQPWACMVIRSATGDTYCRLAYNDPHGPSSQIEIPVAFDTTIAFRECNVASWKEEHDRLVTPMSLSNSFPSHGGDYSNHRPRDRRYDRVTSIMGRPFRSELDDMEPDGYPPLRNQLPAHYMPGFYDDEDDGDLSFLDLELPASPTPLLPKEEEEEELTLDGQEIIDPSHMTDEELEAIIAEDFDDEDTALEPKETLGDDDFVEVSELPEGYAYLKEKV